MDVSAYSHREARRAEPSVPRRAPADFSDIKPIAFYLPQFHPIPENDEWWEAGFTEWTNVSRASPLFPGHYQPHLPAELGFYDLRVPEVRARQAELAREHGVYGFCYYHYWFGGRRLLERPFQEVLASGEPDFPFCLCWANENWTRRWDGLEHEILIGQNHSPEDDIAFIQSLLPAFEDPRYIRVDGRPLLLVYRPGLLPNPRATAERWREECWAAGVEDPFLCNMHSFDHVDPRTIGYDAAVEFPPNYIPHESSEETLSRHPELGDFEGQMLRYLRRTRFDTRPYDFFRGIYPSWDNCPRRGKASTVVVESSPAAFEQEMRALCSHVSEKYDPSRQLLFVNAWNEWGEGCHLEPDQVHGRGFLEALQRVIREGREEVINGCDTDSV